MAVGLLIRGDEAGVSLVISTIRPIGNTYWTTRIIPLTLWGLLTFTQDLSCSEGHSAPITAVWCLAFSTWRAQISPITLVAQARTALGPLNSLIKWPRSLHPSCHGCEWKMLNLVPGAHLISISFEMLLHCKTLFCCKILKRVAYCITFTLTCRFA